MSLSLERQADLLELYAHVEHAWRVASDRSYAHSPQWDSYLGVYREHFGVDPMPAELAIGWLKTGNPHYIDLAVCRARESGMERGNTLDNLMLDVADLRANAATKAGGPFRIRRAIAKDVAFTLIGLSQICSDDSLATASSKAAYWLTEFAPGFGCKASVLELEYPKRWRRKLVSPQEFSEPMTKEEFAAESLEERFASLPHPDGRLTTHEAWAVAIQALPLASEELLGSRR